MPCRTERMQVSPATLVTHFGLKSPLAQKTVALLRALAADHPLPTFSSIPTSLADKPAIQRWGNQLGWSITPAEINHAIQVVQFYFLSLVQQMERQLLARTQTTNQNSWPPSLAPALSTLLEPVANCLAELDWETAVDDQPCDLLKPLYHELLPREIRHALGEYYTPDWLATHLLDVAAGTGETPLRMLDPACGSGTFLMHAIQRVRAQAQRQGCSPQETWQRITAQVVGVDLHPLAVAAARVNYLFATRDLLPAIGSPPTLPIYHGDSILLTTAAGEPSLADKLGTFDLIIGNPPWVGWEHLTESYRQQTLPHWIEQGLFPHGGMATILGSGKKDLSLLMSYVVSDRLLNQGGKLAFVITQGAFKTSSAGEGFRRFQLGRDGTPLKVLRVDDFSAWQPFPGATTKAVTFVWQKGTPTKYPVDYYQWDKPPADVFRSTATPREQLAALPRRLCRGEPMDPQQATSPWLTAAATALADVRQMTGVSDYRAHEGANSGGANAVYWLEVLEWRQTTAVVRNIIAGAKRPVPQVTAEIEAELLYPLLRGKDVRRWNAVPSAYLLLTQDPNTRRGIDFARMERDYPRTLAYLQQFEPMLRERAAYRRYFTKKSGDQSTDRAPFYSMFDVGSYTLAACKVVWHRMLTPLGAAVVMTHAGRPILPQETHAFIPCDNPTEAFYLAAFLNSAPFNFAAASYSPAGGKGFASPHLLTHLRIPKFDPQLSGHVKLSQLGEQRSQQASAAVDGELDAMVRELYRSV